jgi:surfeit locus 1 family protein
MFAGRQFYFRPVLTVCALLGLAVLIFLGVWQMQRLEWKRSLIGKVEARTIAAPIPLDDAIRRWRDGEDMEYTPVRATGIYAQDKEAHVFGILDGRPGYYIFTPLLRTQTALPYAAIVYVNLGFAPQSLKDIDKRPDSIRLDRRIVEGLFRTAERRTGAAKFFRAVDQPSENQWYVRDPALFAAAAGIDAPSYYIDSFAVEGVEWPKGGTTRLDFSNRHLEYALTWFGLAATLIGVWLIFSLPKSK